MPSASLTIVIPTSGTAPHLEPLIEDLGTQTVGAAAVHVVVNNPRSAVSLQPWRRAGASAVRVSYLTKEHYYAKGVNLALRQVDTRYVAVINDDVRLQPTWIEAVTEGLARHPRYGSIASRVVSLRDESVLDSCGDSLYLCGRASANGWLESVAGWRDPQEVFSASGCVATYHTADVRRVGYLDESFTAYMEDVDLGFRLQLIGRPCLFWPWAGAAHFGGATRKTPALAARLAERNSILTAIKNLPRALVPEAARAIAREHARPCSFEGMRSWSAWRAGKSGAAAAIPAALRQRGAIQASRSVSVDYVRSILKSGAPQACHL